MKKFLSAVTAVIFLFCACGWSGVINAQELSILIDGKNPEWTLSPIAQDGVAMVPARAFFESLDMLVTWENTDSAVIATRKKHTFVFKTGEKTFEYNGEMIEAESAAEFINGSVYIPLEAAAKCIDIAVSWDKSSGVLNLTAKTDTEDDTWKNNTGKIDLTGMTVSGNGAAVSGNIINITEGGDFEVTGTLSDGMIHVDTESRVKLRLSGMSLTNSSGPAIYFENSDKGYITMAKNTVNEIADSAEYSEEFSEAKAALFSNDDLEIKGAGTLKITGNYKHGAASDDDIVIEEGTVEITSAGDGIHANDGVYITGGIINIISAQDGIQAEKYAEIEDGEINITTTGEVEDTEGKDLGKINGGALAFGAGDQGMAPSVEMRERPEPPEGSFEEGLMPEAPRYGDMGEEKRQPPKNDAASNMQGGRDDIESTTAIKENNAKITEGEYKENEEIQEEQTENILPSSKGIKAETNLIINGGKININSTDHSMHSADMVIINGGDIILNSESGKGISGHGRVIVGGGNIDIEKSTEGIESKSIMSVNGGIIRINASDDGLNTGSGNGSDFMGEPGRDEIMEKSAAEHQLNINGGDIYINAAFDGLDSNGGLIINGGNVVIEGGIGGGEGALDADGALQITGGTVTAVGGMAVFGKTQTTTQNCINIVYSNSQEAGKKITVVNSNGEAILEYTPSKTYQAVVLSSPLLKTGEKYTLMSDAEEVETFIINSIVTNIGSYGGFEGNNGMRPGKQPAESM